MASVPQGRVAHPDLVIKGGLVFDPVGREFKPDDVSIRDGRIARLGTPAPQEPSARTINAAGQIVAPGLIDSHLHAFPFGQLYGVDVDPLSARSGVTTFIDAGSTGSLNFLAFRKYVIDRVRSNLFAMLNVSAIGQGLHGIRTFAIWEGELPKLLDLPSAIELIEGNRDVIVAVKVRINTGLPSLLPLAAARELADEVGLPLVLHVEAPPPSFGDMLPYLRPGDVVTHIYHSPPGAVVDSAGRIRGDFLDARARGVIMDTGSARNSTNFAVARAAIECGFVPDTISTDLSTLTVEKYNVDLPTVLNKFMALGLGLEDVLTMATIAPARLLPGGHGFGQLREGMPADVALLSVEEGRFQYEDMFGNTITCGKRLVSAATIKDGEVLSPLPYERPRWRFLWSYDP